MKLKSIKYIQMAYVLFTLLMSFLFIPRFNHGDNFFIFYKWDIFSSSPKKIIYDITWDDGQSFLFRDHRDKAKKLGMNVPLLFYLSQTQKLQRIKKDHLKSLKKLGLCEKLLFLKLEGPLYKHIFFNGSQKTILQESPLCEN